MISFKQNSDDFKKFVQFATIDFTMKEIAFEIGKDSIMTSATNDIGNCWCINIGKISSSEGKGTFAVNVDDLQKIMKNMTAKTEYQFKIDDTTMAVKSIYKKSKIHLPSLEEHQRLDNTESSWVTPKEKYGGKRFKIGMTRDKQREIFIPLTPAGKPWEQTFSIDPKAIKPSMKGFGVFDTKSIILSLEQGSNNLKLHAADDATEHTEAIVILDGFESTFDWEVSFDEVLNRIINMAEGSLFFSVTEATLPHSEGISNANCGIWTVIQTERMTSHYWLTPSMLEES